MVTDLLKILFQDQELILCYGILVTDLNDLHLLDVQEMVWKQIGNGDVLGSSPSPRRSMGMAAVSNKIMIYGGTGITGMSLSSF